MQPVTCLLRKFSSVSDVNYFFALTTIISPARRQLLFTRGGAGRPPQAVFLTDRNSSSELWECGKLAAFWRGFQGLVEREVSLPLAFHAFHSPAFPQLSFPGFCCDADLSFIRARRGFPPL